MGFGPTSVMAQRIKAGTGALVGGPSIVAQASTVNTTGVTYNPVTGRYIVAWHQMPGDFIAAASFGRWHADRQRHGDLDPGRHLRLALD